MISARQKYYNIVVCYNNYKKSNKNVRRILFGMNYIMNCKDDNKISTEIYILISSHVWTCIISHILNDVIYYQAEFKKDIILILWCMGM